MITVTSYYKGVADSVKMILHGRNLHKVFLIFAHRAVIITMLSSVRL